MEETNFLTREIPQSWSKAKDGEKKREKERLKTMVIRMVSYALQTPPRVAHTKLPGCTVHKPPGPIMEYPVAAAWLKMINQCYMLGSE